MRWRFSRVSVSCACACCLRKTHEPVKAHVISESSRLLTNQNTLYNSGQEKALYHCKYRPLSNQSPLYIRVDDLVTYLSFVILAMCWKPMFRKKASFPFFAVESKSTPLLCKNTRTSPRGIFGPETRVALKIFEKFFDQACLDLAKLTISCLTISGSADRVMLGV